MARGWIVVDREAPFGVGAPSVGDMTEFGAVDYETGKAFHGHDCSKATFEAFEAWLVTIGDKFTFWSDNPEVWGRYLILKVGSDTARLCMTTTQSTMRWGMWKRCG